MWRAALILFLASPAFAQEKPKDRIIDEEKGYVLTKPKDEKWAVEQGDSQMYKDVKSGFVKHRIDSPVIEVQVQTKSSGQSWSPLKDVAGDIMKNFEKGEKETLKVTPKKNEERKFPGAGGPKAQYLEFIREEGQNKVTRRVWLFIDRQNPDNMLQIWILGTDDDCKKYEKEINQVLAGLQTFKVKKKK